MNKTGIIGAGFSGIMTAVQLINKSTKPCEILLIEKDKNIGGAAYNPYSDKHLLNVSTNKMSAFPDNPDHFLGWVMQQDEFIEKDKTLIANAYLPRKLYGEYLKEIWKEAKKLAEEKAIKISFINAAISELDLIENSIALLLENGTKLIVDQCVIATGNHIPRNRKIENMDFYQSPNYFQNPWKRASVQNVNNDLPVLIIGNGLTMVDTVFGLLEQGFKGSIYSISPNGFNILPHRHGGLQYSKLVEELSDNMTLYDLTKLVIKHIKAVREYGVSAEPVINSLRPYTQKIWQSFSDREKEIFMARLRHLWGVARHRLPMHSHDKIQQLRIDGKLHIHSGKIINIKETNKGIEVHYFNKKENKQSSIMVSRVINCTGPNTDLTKQKDNFLKKCLQKGIVNQDGLKLGISANIKTFQILDTNGNIHSNLFTLGSNLSGELWESTAVNELRGQTEKLAGVLVNTF
ncbi:MAG: FAD/NAD(P)-binding protein [Vicingaceae bacterium]|nr:FAD/NAD(P)-binding protein [Vicingaceae bacterium]